MEKEKKLSTAAEPEAKKETAAAPVKAEKTSAAAPAKAEKKPAAKPRASKAKAESLKPTVIVQFQGSEVDLDTLVEAAKADFRQIKKRASINDLKLYVKPEEHTAYYVINEQHNGSVAF